MKLLVVPCLLASSVAFAQAPGETPPTPPPSTTMPAPAPPSSDQIDVMRNRFSVGLGAGALGVSNDTTEVEFRTLSFALRYRAHPSFEIELELFGGRQSLDGEDGPLAVGGGYLGGRYRIAPGRRWNGYLGIGLGQVMIERKDTTEEMLDGSKRALFRVGGGLEHRWQRFSVGLEVALLALGKRSDHDPDAPSRDAMLTGESAGGVDVALRAGCYF